MTLRPPHSTYVKRLAVAAGSVARFCDYTEHVERSNLEDVVAAGAELRQLALDLAKDLELNAIDLYARRLDVVERRYALGLVDGFQGGSHVEMAETWRDLQLVQGHHDRLYRADVWGLSRRDQLVHTCLHLTKLVGHLAEAAPDQDALRERLIPDILLFGIKLATLTGEVLPSQPYREQPASRSATAAT